ncbi:MAG TPA: Fe-S cluster assembly protein SufB, partial [Caulobacteraceae bacterium]
MAAVAKTIETVAGLEAYKHGFVTDIETDFAPVGLDESTIRFISAKKGEPEWMLEWRLAAFERWQAMEEPTWAKVDYEPVDYQALHY